MMYCDTYDTKINNSVLEDKINKISNFIHRDTLRGGADVIRVNMETFFRCILPIVDKLKKRYVIECDETVKNRSVLVIYSKEPKYSGEIKIK